MFSEVTRLDECVKVITGKEEGGRKKGITGARTAGALMFLDNNKNEYPYYCPMLVTVRTIYIQIL